METFQVNNLLVIILALIPIGCGLWFLWIGRRQSDKATTAYGLLFMAWQAGIWMFIVLRLVEPLHLWSAIGFPVFFSWVLMLYRRDVRAYKSHV